MIKFEAATAANIAEMKTLLLGHGVNQWNFIPEEAIDQILGLLHGQNGLAFLACDQQQIIGFAMCALGRAGPAFLEKYAPIESVMYVGEVVVHPDYNGQGIATRLLTLSIDKARELGFAQVFIARHEENLGSAGMMKKAGFVMTDTYYDPEKRSVGSRHTTVMQYNLLE